MSRPVLRPLTALAQGLDGLRRRPRRPLAFSALGCGVHLLGWSLFAAGHEQTSGVLAALLKIGGVVLYAGSVVWLIEGLTRIGLALPGDPLPRWSSLCRWHGRPSRDLAVGLLNTALALAAAALAAFMAWSLTLMLLPLLSVPVAVAGVAAVVAVGLSQLFNPCLVLEARLSPSRAFSRGLELFSGHWRGLLALAPVLLGLLAAPFGLGLLTEALHSGVGVVVTVLAMVAVLPLLAATTAAAYRQLGATAAPLRAGDR